MRKPEEYLNDGSQRRNTPFISTPEFPYVLRKKAFRYAYRATAKHVTKTRAFYSRKNVYEKFIDAGLPEVPARFFAAIYATRPVQKLLAKSKIMSHIKERFKKHE